MKFPRKIVGKTKINRIRNQEVRVSCGIQPIRGIEWDGHVTRMDTDRLVNISMGNVLA